MEIKKGYKMTDVGVIPEDWEVKSIGDICVVKDGTHQTPNYTYFGIPFYSVENISNNDFSNVKYISEEEHIILSSNSKIEKGDVLMTRIGSIGCCKYIDWEVKASFYVSLALLKFQDDECARYFTHYSETNLFKDEIEQNSLQFAVPQKINLGNIPKIRIILPSILKEQQVIADALTKVDNLITSLTKVIEKKKLIKKGTMQKLLSGEVRLDGYNNIIKSVNLSDIGEIKAGGTPSTNVPSYWGGTINWLQSGAVKNRVLDIRDVEKTITYDGLASSSAYLIKENSVLIAITGATCGNIAYLPFKSAANQSVVAIQVNVGFNSKYIFYMLIQNSDKIVNNRGGSAQGGVAVNILKEIELCIHEDIDEQTGIADILTTMDNEIEALEKERDKYKCIKQGMMQQLLTGKIRLTCQ